MGRRRESKGRRNLKRRRKEGGEGEERAGRERGRGGGHEGREGKERGGGGQMRREKRLVLKSQEGSLATQTASSAWVSLVLCLKSKTPAEPAKMQSP